MQTLDVKILLFINGFARTSWTFDSFMMLVVLTSLLKGGVLVALLWWSWERTDARRLAPPVVLTLAGVLGAITVARVLQNFLPARQRPLYNPEVAEAGFVLPYGVPADWLYDYSSFPSDHAVLVFALATALFLAHRGVGAFAYAWAFFVVCLPRVYLGLHYPSDIVGGAVIGIGIMAATARLPVPERASHVVAHLACAHRGWFYAGLFLLSYLIATMFEDARDLAEFAEDVLSRVF